MNNDVTITIRRILYQSTGLESRVLFDPVDGADNSVIVDLTYDVMGHTRIYHDKLSESREVVSKASVVVCDNAQLARAAKLFNSSVVTLPFGYANVRKIEGDFTVGVLNHDEDRFMHNKWGKSIITSVCDKFRCLIYGNKMKEYEVTQDFNDFISRIDVLLLPVVPRVLVPTTLVLSAMMAGCVVITNGGYAVLSAATGVTVMDSASPLSWRRVVETFSVNPRKVMSLRERNQSFVRQVSKQSQEVVLSIANRVATI